MRRLALACLLAAGAARAGTVTVTVQGVRNDQGQIVVGICTRTEFLGDHCAFGTRVPARAGTVTARVPDVPAGTYAVQAFHDADGNGRLERSFLGIPREGVGLSRDPAPGFGPPSFGQCALAFGAAPAAVSVTLRYP